MMTPKNVNAMVRMIVPSIMLEEEYGCCCPNRKKIKVTAEPEIMLYFTAVKVVSNKRGLVCSSAMCFSSSMLLLCSRSRSSACREKKAASVAEAREVNKISKAARAMYRTPGSREIKRSK